MPNLLLKDLFKKYLDETLTPEEFSQLYELIRNGSNQEFLDELPEGILTDPAFAIGAVDYDKQEIFTSLLEKIGEREAAEASPAEIRPASAEAPPAVVIPLLRRRWIAAGAAAIVLLTAGAIYWNVHHRSTTYDQVIATRKEIRSDVPPGKIGAILTLSNGQQIQLDSSQNGLLAQQGNTRLLKQGGLLSYKPEDSSADRPSVSYNIISIPRGCQYQLVLPDGSKVWLNAESSLRFPTAFSGNTRDVTLTGEAYFEVEKKKDMPFTVEVNDLKVRVLGTSFNLMAYNDEGSVRTTLLEGAVKIMKGKENILLKPGQQAAMNRATSAITVAEADVDGVIAWKSGWFEFKGDDIGTIMRQLGRWYNVETGYEGKIPEGHYTGTIGRNIPLLQVLKMLEVNDLHFRIEGKKIIVLK